MLAQDLFSQPDVQLPLIRDAGDFLIYASKVLSTYDTLFRSISGPDELSQAMMSATATVKSACDGVRSVLEAYFQGYPHTAYERLAATIQIIRPYLDRLFASSATNNEIRNLYRFRLQISPPFSREEMFQIPFELRHKIGTQRYSIPGLPSLYLAGSVYTCWAEMFQPAFSDIQASCFWLKDEKKVSLVDFSHRPAWVSEFLAPYRGRSVPRMVIDYAVAHAICWPLMAASSVKTLYRSDAFKPEYVLPQILLQWISQQPDIDGIRYFSTHVNCLTPNPHWTSNYMFPARTLAPQGRCSKLCSLFKLTEPVNWQLL